MKKILPLLILFLIGFSSKAMVKWTVDGIHYDESLSIDDYNIAVVVGATEAKKTGDLVIPSSVKVKDVDSYGNEHTRTLQVCYIDKEAFKGSAQMTSITLPSTIRVIGYRAFQNCVSLTKFTIPRDCFYFGDECLKGCTALKTVQSNCIFSPDMASQYGYPTGYIPHSLSYPDPPLPPTVENVIWNGTRYIHPHLLSGNKVIKSLNLPSVVIIDRDAFYDTNIEDVVLSGNLKSIGSGAFAKTKIKSLKLPESVEFIGESAFSGSNLLKSINIPKNITNLPFGLFSNTGLEEITIPEGVTEIGHACFSFCENLKFVDIPESVNRIGIRAFGYCPKLEIVLMRPLSIPYVPYNTRDDYIFIYFENESERYLTLYVPSQLYDEYIDEINPDTSPMAGWYTAAVFPLDFYYGIDPTGLPLYLVGSPTGWAEPTEENIDLYNKWKFEATEDGYYGNFYIDSDKTMFRFYHELNGWQSKQIGYQAADRPTDFSLTHDAAGSAFLNTSYFNGKGSWNITNWQGGMMHIHVNTKDRTVTFSDQATSGNCTISSHISSTHPSEVYNLNGIRLGNSTDNLPSGIYIVKEGDTVRKISK